MVFDGAVVWAESSHGCSHLGNLLSLAHVNADHKAILEIVAKLVSACLDSGSALCIATDCCKLHCALCKVPAMVALHVTKKAWTRVSTRVSDSIHQVAAVSKGVDQKLLARAHPDAPRRRLCQSELKPMSD